MQKADQMVHLSVGEWNSCYALASAGLAWPSFSAGICWAWCGICWWIAGAVMSICREMLRI